MGVALLAPYRTKKRDPAPIVSGATMTTPVERPEACRRLVLDTYQKMWNLWR
jgi:hypothetical protein